ncbi:AMP-binding protein [uncultured Polaribacter sp.]|uniref:AMP-binding protein n=1 Tax=uncultured Polaribacter sp. TaxID=174711 RepID=UPI002634BA80|nr:AMP-binding protein [uncultured Polaribacter sp.]
MTNTSFHKDFKLQGKSFSTVYELLSFTKKSFDDDVYEFLSVWFSSKDSIVVQTSGSTGVPKPILLKKEYVRNSAIATGKFFKTYAKTKALLCLSPVYIAGKLMLVRALTLGWHLDIIQPISNPLEKLKSDYDFCAMVPLQLENSIPFLSKIKQLIVGGGVVSKALIQKFKSSSCSVFATYGMTETITHIAVKKLNNFTLQPQFYKVLANVKIYKDSRNCLIIDAPRISSDIVITNDVVELISDKEFRWLGRYDNVINSGAIKLYPEKIEEKLAQVINERFFVAGKPDAYLGEKLILIIEGKQRKIDFNDTFLIKYEVPKTIFFIDKFVETPTQKIQRKKTLDLIFKAV